MAIPGALVTRAMLRVARRRGADLARLAGHGVGSSSASACAAAAPRVHMGTMKDMMVRAAIDHVASRIANNSLGTAAVGGLQDAEDVDTWRAIVVRPPAGCAPQHGWMLEQAGLPLTAWGAPLAGARRAWAAPPPRAARGKGFRTPTWRLACEGGFVRVKRGARSPPPP